MVDSLLIGAIVGGVIAAVLVIVLITLVAACFYTSYKNSKNAIEKDKRQQRLPKNQYQPRPGEGVKRVPPRVANPYFFPRGVPSASRKAQWNQRMLRWYYPHPHLMPAPYPMRKPFPQLTVDDSRYKDSTRDDESVSEQSEEEVRPPHQQQPFVFAVPPMYYNFPMRGKVKRPTSSVIIRELDSDFSPERERREPEPDITETREEFQKHVTNITTTDNNNPVVSSIPGDIIFGNTEEPPLPTTKAGDAHGQYSIIDTGVKKPARVLSETVYNDPVILSSSTVVREVESYPAQDDEEEIEYVVLRRKNRESYTQDVPVVATEPVNIVTRESLSQTLPKRPPTPPFDAVVRDSNTSVQNIGVSRKDDVEYIASTHIKNTASPFSLLYMDSIGEVVKSRGVAGADDPPSQSVELNESSRFSYRAPSPPPLSRKISSEYYDNRGRDSDFIVVDNNLGKTVQFDRYDPEIIPDYRRSDNFETIEMPSSPPPPPPPPPMPGNIPPAPPLPSYLMR